LPDHPFTTADLPDLQARFEAGYRVLFGRLVPGVDIEVTAWILRAAAPAPGRAAETLLAGADKKGEAARAAASGSRVLFDPTQRDFHEVPVYSRSIRRAPSA
jgi:N-methylhydantoinase A